MKNHVIQSLWIGTKVSPIEQLCIKSFLDNGHEFHLYVYDGEIEGCPNGTIFKDASEIIPRELIYKDVLKTYTSFANWFRYKLLFERGGWWVDMDVICLKYFDFEPDYCFTTEIMFDFNVPQIIANNAIMKAPRKADFLFDMLEYMDTRDLPNATWGEFGPRLLDKVLKQYESGEFIQHPQVFCPLNWNQVNLFFLKDFDFSFDKSYAIHLWNNIWSKHGHDKYAIYPPTSIIEKLKAKYLFS